MSMTFTKLFSSITESTVWCEDAPTRIVWITMLAMADKNGRVWASIPGLANRARVEIWETEAALEKFLSPDPYSRTSDHEGRRIEVIDGGWRLLNHGKYRAIRDVEERKAYKAEWIRNRRAEESVDNVDNVDRSRPPYTQAEAEAEADINTDAWNLYVSHRKELKAKRLTPRGEGMAKKKLATLSHADQLRCVEKTVENGWIGLFPEKLSGSHKQDFADIHARNRKAAGLD